MQVIVIALGSAGDVHPNVGLALALQRRGIDVLFVATEVFRPLAERAGLRFEGVGSVEQYEAALRDPDLWHPTRSFAVVVRRLILPALRPIYEIIANHYRRGETVITAPAFAFGARIAQDKLGVPLATVHLQPIMLRSAVEPCCFGFPDILQLMPRFLRAGYYWAVDRLLLERQLDDVNNLRSELGLDHVSRIFDLWVHSPQLVIGLFPEWYAPQQSDWPPNVVMTGFPLWDESEFRSVPPQVEEFVGGAEPPIVFTAGSAMLHANAFFKASLQVAQACGRRGLLLTQYPEQLPQKLPTTVRHFHYIPFSAVLPRCAALVHHGGIGTAAQAMAAGIPQLIVPYSHDQPDNAVRIRRLGVGDFVQPKHYTKGRATEVLQKLLSSPVRERCRQTAAKIGRNSLETAAELVERLGTENRARLQAAAK